MNNTISLQESGESSKLIPNDFGGYFLTISLNVPSGNGLGAAVDVSALVGRKTFSLNGNYTGVYEILGSHDGVTYSPLLFFSNGDAGVQSVDSIVPFVVRFIKIRRNASNAVSISVTAQQANPDSSANAFVAFSAIAAGTEGPATSAPIDLNTIVSPNGFGPSGMCVILGGSFRGGIVVEGSSDGLAFLPVSDGFIAGSDVSQTGTVTSFSPQVVAKHFRYLRWRLLPGTTLHSTVNITLGGTVGVPGVVTKIIAGAGVNVSPVSGTGQVTITSTGGGGGGSLNDAYQFGLNATDQTLPLEDANGGGFVVDGSSATFTGTHTFNVRGNGGKGLRVRRDTGRVVVDAVDSVTTVPTRTFTVVDSGLLSRWPTVQFQDHDDGIISFDALFKSQDPGAGGLSVLQLMQPDALRASRVALVSSLGTGLTAELALRQGDTQLGQLRAYGTGGASTGAPTDPRNTVLRGERKLALVSGAGGGTDGSVEVFGGDTANSSVALFNKSVAAHTLTIRQPDAASASLAVRLDVLNAAAGVSGLGSTFVLGFSGGVGHAWSLVTPDAASAAAAGKTLTLRDNGTDFATFARNAQTTTGDSHDLTVVNTIAAGATAGSAMVAVMCSNAGNAETSTVRNPRLRVGFTNGSFWNIAAMNSATVANAGKDLVFSQIVGSQTARPFQVHPNYVTLGQGLRTKAFIGTHVQTISADQNNFTPAAPGDPGGPGSALTYMLTPSGANRTITGWRVDAAVANSSATDGVVLKIINASSTLDLILPHDSGSSDAVNRFYLPNNTDVTLKPRCSITLWYESQSALRWFAWGGIAKEAGGAAVAGDTFQWEALEMFFPTSSDASVSTTATLESLSGNEDISVIGLAHTTPQGFFLPRREIPSGTTQVKFRFRARPQTAPASTAVDEVVLTLASRKITAGGAVSAWQAMDFAVMDFAATTTDWKTFEETFTFASFPTIDPAPDELWQFEISRKTASGSDTLDSKIYISNVSTVYS